jgi:leader peptidase (prepilin peptidase)/N-methyltransferase
VAIVSATVAPGLTALCGAAVGALLGPLLRRCVIAYSVHARPGSVEAVAAAVLAVLAVRVREPLALLAFCWVALLGVVLGFVDGALHRLPDRLTLTAFGGAVLLFGAAALVEHRPVTALLGGLAMAGWYLLLAVIRPSAMGLGDVKLALSLGTALGWLGWFTTVVGTIAGLGFAGLYAALLLALRRIDRKAQLAHGPFMLIGALAAVAFTG